MHLLETTEGAGLVGVDLIGVNLAAEDLALRTALARERRRPGGRVVTVFAQILPVPKGNTREIFWPFQKGGRKTCPTCKRPDGHPIVRETVRVKKAEAAAVRLFSALCANDVRAPLTGTVRFDCVTVLRIAPSWPKWQQQAARAGAWWPTNANAGDRGNHLKMIEDVLEGAKLVGNDSQFTTGYVEKVYGDAPGYLCTLTELDEVNTLEEWKRWKAAS